jgi:hypothetical protein
MKILLFVVFVFSMPLYGQEILFKTVAVSGKVELQRKGEWNALKISDGLFITDLIRIGPDARITLLHITGKELELSTPGEFHIADFVKADDPSIKKYIDYIHSENGGNSKSSISSTFASAASINVLLPGDSSHAHVYASRFYITWKAKANYGPYIVAFKDQNNNLVYSVETSDEKIVFNFDNDLVFKHDVLYVTVFAKSNHKIISEKRVIKRMNKTQQMHVRGLVDAINPDRTTAVGQIVYAGLCEEKQLYIDAVDAYLRAIELDVRKDSREVFDDFLARHGFVK